MITSIVAWLAALIVSIISSTGYFGIFLLMALESACVPIPSEVIMPFSGFLVFAGKFSLWQVALWGAVGNLAGSILAYRVGVYGGLPLIEKYGKYILISHRDLDRAHKWFEKHGQSAVFFSRLLPAVRTFISLPAGIARMNFKIFCFYTFAGSLLWSYALAYAGLKMGENWQGLKIYFEKFDYLIITVFILLTAWWIRRHLKAINRK